LLILLLESCNLKIDNVAPANSNATPEAKALYKKIWQLQSKGIMFAHQDAYLYGVNWKTNGTADVKQVSDDYPAVFGWELGDLELGKTHSLDSVDFNEIREGIKWVHQNGGINTISWHTNNPLTGGSAWDTSSDQVVKSILPGGSKHQDFVKMLEKTASFFSSITDNNGKLIPVIFRPYHEHTGSWFWWGQKLCSSDEYIALWQFTIDYFNKKGLNNILYAYSSAGNIESAEQFLERYPGDELIDIMGFDIYQRNIEQKDEFIASIKKQMNMVVPIASARNKIAILAETGLNGIPDPTWWTETLLPAIEEFPLSYVLVWRNASAEPKHYFAPYPGQISAINFVEFKNKSKVLFLSEIK
jgi:mannan endo-1,4-beta-mannosidase